MEIHADVLEDVRTAQRVAVVEWKNKITVRKKISCEPLFLVYIIFNCFKTLFAEHML